MKSPFDKGLEQRFGKHLDKAKNKAKEGLDKAKQAIDEAIDIVIEEGIDSLDKSIDKSLDKGTTLASSVAERLARELDQGVSLVREMVDGLPVLVSLEIGGNRNQDQQYDEKHYFVVPYALSATGFSLHTMRCLPDGVPEINDLPKRRVFHFPDSHYEAALRHHMLEVARDAARADGADASSTLEQLADSIDALDNKLTYGMLLVGGIAAIFNPLVGAGIAAKALMPGVASLLNKYGLRPLGQEMTRRQVEKAARDAEQRVMKSFSESTTLKVVNPILQELALALRTSEHEHDPLYDPNLADGSIPELDQDGKEGRWRELTELAVYRIYRDVYHDASQHQAARLGPEDIRWLAVLFARFEHR